MMISPFQTQRPLGDHTTPLAVAYSYGGRQTIVQFNTQVARYRAPSRADLDAQTAEGAAITAYIDNYCGNISNPQPTDTNWLHTRYGVINGACRTGNKWTGLYKDPGNEYSDGQAGGRNHHFYYENWTGIDCNGLTMHGLRYAAIPAPYAADQIMGNQDASIPGVMLGDVCITDRDPHAGDNPSVIGPGNKVCTARGNIHIDAPAQPPYPLTDTNVRKFFNDPNGRLMHYWSRTGQNVKLIHEGDVVRYGTNHISTVHSDRPTCTNPNNSATCTYKIIHAYGESNADVNGDHIADEFTRKVLITPNQVRLPDGRISLANPTGFGRIKLWD